jgi:hypothetical protein
MSIKLTRAETRILRFYRSLREERFCRSIASIARECSVGTRTVQRANTKFQGLGILSWVSGNSASWRPDSRGQANKYRFVLSGVEGSGVTPAMVRAFRRLTRGRHPNQPNQPNKPNILITYQT